MKEAYTFTCNLLVAPPKIDRFYMDMRVYSVAPLRSADNTHKENSLVWRGIYMAFEIDPANNEVA
ncbi:MAG: hypothetical protein O3C57_03910 [Verrucomicrobia bacterium]|nr:hypothetical protein [Verrucomicrobiota bacterium]